MLVKIRYKSASYLEFQGSCVLKDDQENGETQVFKSLRIDFFSISISIGSKNSISIGIIIPISRKKHVSTIIYFLNVSLRCILILTI